MGGEKTSKVEMEIAMLEKELTPVERYALRFIETTDDQFSDEAVKQAEVRNTFIQLYNINILCMGRSLNILIGVLDFQLDIDQAKKDWELNRLKQQKEEEERRAELEEDDMLFTYTTEDGMNQVPKRTNKVTTQKKTVVVEPSRKSKRPPRPKQLESDSEGDSESIVTPQPVKRGRGRPPKKSKVVFQAIADGSGKLDNQKSGSTSESILLRNKLIGSPVASSPFVKSNGKRRTYSENSDVDIQ